MIIAAYTVAASTIAGAGHGIRVEEDIEAGRIIVAPDAIPRVHRWSEIEAMPDPAAARAASVRWFEEFYTVSLEWPDECYINHSFTPNGLWHLGFVFAARRIVSGEELTIDYRHLLPEGETESFVDSGSGAPIIGWSGRESLRRSTSELLRLLG
jgi:hypothetical protein